MALVFSVTSSRALWPGTVTTFNFLHFSIQEYLAAYYITNLPPDVELQIIEEKF